MSLENNLSAGITWLSNRISTFTSVTEDHVTYLVMWRQHQEQAWRLGTVVCIGMRGGGVRLIRVDNVEIM